MDDAKRRAAEAAVPLLASGMVLGLGTGSTADHFLVALGAAVAEGRLRGIVGVPTSRQSERRAGELGIPLTTLARHPVIDVTVDGADEVDPQLRLIKGLGGALVREKIVAQNSRRFVIIADGSKTGGPARHPLAAAGRGGAVRRSRSRTGSSAGSGPSRSCGRAAGWCSTPTTAT